MTVTAVIVTNCTQRKAIASQADTVDLPQHDTVGRLADAWGRHLAQTNAMCTPARHLYQGRSIADAAAAAASLGSPWHVISAGLGLVPSERLVPSYDCTVARSSDLGLRLMRLHATEAEWWNALTAGSPHPLSQLIKRSLTLLALPGSYLRMVKDDLANVPPAQAEQLRVFTSAVGRQLVPEHLQACVMPYDERLESVQAFAGTRSDFAQRALRHFVVSLRASQLPVDQARESVSSALAQLRLPPPRPRGKRMSDEELKQVLRAQWQRYSGSSTRLLRYLRDEALISCEQKRFSRLWQGLAAEQRK